jgi:hypothetical protein
MTKQSKSVDKTWGLKRRGRGRDTPGAQGITAWAEQYAETDFWAGGGAMVRPGAAEDLASENDSARIDFSQKPIPAAGPAWTKPTNEQAVRDELLRLERLSDGMNERASLMLADGTFLQEISGKGGVVPATREVLSAIDAQAKNSVILSHTHLEDISFSMTDIYRLWKHEAIRELQMITPPAISATVNNRKVYQMSIGNEVRPALKELWDKAEDIKAYLQSKYFSKLERGELTLEGFYSIIRHERNKELANFFYWHYHSESDDYSAAELAEKFVFDEVLSYRDDHEPLDPMAVY